MHLVQATTALGSPRPRSALTLANGWWPARRPLPDAQHPFRKSAALCVEPTRANSCYLASADTIWQIFGRDSFPDPLRAQVALLTGCGPARRRLSSYLASLAIRSPQGQSASPLML